MKVDLTAIWQQLQIFLGHCLGYINHIDLGPLAKLAILFCAFLKVTIWFFSSLYDGLENKINTLTSANTCVHTHTHTLIHLYIYNKCLLTPGTMPVHFLMHLPMLIPQVCEVGVLLLPIYKWRNSNHFWVLSTCKVLQSATLPHLVFTSGVVLTSILQMKENWVQEKWSKAPKIAQSDSFQSVVFQASDSPQPHSCSLPNALPTMPAAQHIGGHEVRKLPASELLDIWM